MTGIWPWEWVDTAQQTVFVTQQWLASFVLGILLCLVGILLIWGKIALPGGAATRVIGFIALFGTGALLMMGILT